MAPDLVRTAPVRTKCVEAGGRGCVPADECFPATMSRPVDVPPTSTGVAHAELMMRLAPVPAPAAVPAPPGFTLRRFRADAAEADRQAWAEVEVSGQGC